MSETRREWLTIIGAPLIALGLLGVVGAIVHLLRKLQAAKSIQGAAAATAELRQAGTDDGVK